MEGPATHVLLIGVGGYPYGKAFGIPALQSPIRSVDALRACIASTHDAVSFGDRPLKQIVSISGECATADRLSTEVWAWIERLQSHDGNLGIVYVAGHGVRAGDADILLCDDFGKTAHKPWAGAADLTATWQAIMRHVRGDVLMLVDICRTTPSCDLPRAGASPLVDPPLTEVIARGYCQIFATREGNDARGHRDGHSWFADALLGTLRGHEAIADPARPGKWHIDTSLFEKTVTDLLAQESRSAGHAQLAARSGSEHFPLVELTTPPRIETIRRQFDVRRRFERLFAGLTASKSDGALPREDASRAIADVRRQFGSGTLWVLGPPGSGKSTALAFVASTHAESIVLYVSRTEGSQSLPEARAYVLAAIETWLSEEGRQAEGLARWNHVSDDSPRLLIIDGLDEADGLAREPADLGLPARLPAGLVVAIGWRGLERPAFASISAQVDYRLSQDNTTQREIVARYVRGATGLADPVLAETERMAQGNFLFARLMLNLAQSHPSDFTRAKNDALRSHEGLALVALERAVSASHDSDMAARVLGAIAAAAEPVDARTIAAMIEADAYDVETILRELGQGLVGAREDGNRTLWRYEHDVFEACAYRRFGGRKIESRMVDAFAAGTWGRLEHGGYAARWRSYHLRKLGRSGELQALVLERDWIESQLRLDPSGRLIQADLDNLDLAISHETLPTSLGLKFVIAVIRCSVQSWWAVGKQQPSQENLADLGIIGQQDVMHLLLYPAYATINRLEELLPICDAQERHIPVKLWLSFAGPLQDADDRRTVLRSLVPYLAPEDLEPWFQQLRKVIDYDNSADLLRAAVEAHDEACLPLVEQLWNDQRDAAREGIIRFLRLGAGTPRVQRELADLLLEDPQYADHVQTAKQTKLRVDRSHRDRRRWALEAIESAACQDSAYSFDQLFEALGDDFPSELLLITRDLTPRRVEALAKCQSRPPSFDTQIAAAIRAMPEPYRRIDAWKHLLLTSRTDLGGLAEDLLREAHTLDKQQGSVAWLVAALCLLENSETGEREPMLMQLALEQARVLDIGDLRELRPLRVQRGHEATVFVAGLLCREAIMRDTCYRMLEHDWWKFVPLIADATSAAALVAKLAAEERPDNLQRPQLQDFCDGRHTSVLDASARLAAQHPDWESAAHALLFLACLGGTAAYEASLDLPPPPTRPPMTSPEWHWRVMIDHLESLVPADRRGTLSRLRTMLERLASDDATNSATPTSRHDMLDQLLAARAQHATELLSALTRQLLRHSALGHDRIRRLRRIPVLLKGSLEATWHALGGNEQALRELVSWQVNTPFAIRNLLWTAANGKDARSALAAFELRAGLGEELDVHWWMQGLKIGAIDVATFTTYVAEDWAPDGWSSSLDRMLETISELADPALLQPVWDRDWSVETRIDAFSRVSPENRLVLAWVLDKIPDALDQTTASPSLLKKVRDVIQSADWLVTDPAFASALTRLHAIERRWAVEMADERWQVSLPEPPAPFPLAKLERLERAVLQDQGFSLHDVRSLLADAEAEPTEIKHRLAAIASRTDLWQVDQYLYQCVDMVPRLDGDAVATVRRELVECFLFDPSCRVKGHTHVWFARALSTLIDDNERSLCETTLSANYPPQWAAHALAALAGDAMSRRRTSDFALAVAKELLEQDNLRDSVEMLKVADIDDTGLWGRVIDYLQRLAASGMQLAAVENLRFPPAVKLALVRECGSDGLLADFVFAHLDDSELVDALRPEDLLPAVMRLGSMDFASASNGADRLLAAILPHLVAADAQHLFDTLLRAWLGTTPEASANQSRH